MSTAYAIVRTSVRRNAPPRVEILSVVWREAFKRQLRHVQHLPVARFPFHEHEQDALGHQAPAHEPQDLAGWFVKPLGVIDEADQWPSRGRFGEQTEHRETDEEPIWSVPRHNPERDLQRSLLWLR